MSGLSIRDTLARLRDAGLDSIPGGGAEILDDQVRRRVSPLKCSTDEWAEVHRVAHSLGMSTTATMMFGCGETLDERVNHLDVVRRIQQETGGFTAFIPWTFQKENTALGRSVKHEATAVEYLKTLAVSRLYLEDVPNVQASWVTQGLKLCQLALRFGANDVGSVMIEENVVAAAGAHHPPPKRNCAGSSATPASSPSGGTLCIGRSFWIRPVPETLPPTASSTRRVARRADPGRVGL